MLLKATFFQSVAFNIVISYVFIYFEYTFCIDHHVRVIIIKKTLFVYVLCDITLNDGIHILKNLDNNLGLTYKNKYNPKANLKVTIRSTT